MASTPGGTPRSALRCFVRCPAGTEWLVRDEIRAAVDASGSLTTSSSPPQPVPVQPPCFNVAFDSSFVEGQTAEQGIPGVVSFVLSATEPSTFAHSLKRVVRQVVEVRSVEEMCAYVTAAQGAIRTAEDARRHMEQPEVADAVTNAVLRTGRLVGLLDSYVPPVPLSADVLASARPFGGMDTKAGVVVRESQQVMEEAEVARGNAFLEALAAQKPAPRSTMEEGAEESVVFRVTAERLDKHTKTLKSYDLADAVGHAIGDQHDEDWTVSMRFANCFFIALHRTTDLLVGLRLHNPNVPKGTEGLQEQFAAELQRRAIGQAIAAGRLALSGVRYAVSGPGHFKHDLRVAKGLNAMHPGLAHYLVALAQVRPGELVLDPMAGSGTVLMEGLLSQPGALFVGGDLDLPHVRHSLRNCSATHFNEHYRALLGNTSHAPGRSVERDGKVPRCGGDAVTAGRWNAVRLPFRSESFDVVISDMPFGKRCGNAGINAKLYPKLLRELARVLAPGTGRAVLLTLESSLLRGLVAESDGVPPDEPSFVLADPPPHKVDMNGLTPTVFVLKKRICPPHPD